MARFEIKLKDGKSYKSDDSNAIYDWARKNTKWKFDLKPPRKKNKKKNKKKEE